MSRGGRSFAARDSQAGTRPLASFISAAGCRKARQGSKKDARLPLFKAQRLAYAYNCINNQYSLKPIRLAAGRLFELLHTH
jgi:hypothetical protein